jgi:hypothetical protein
MIESSKQERAEQSPTYESVRAELIEALRDCGLTEEEIFKDLDSSPYGRKTDRE